MQSVSRKSKGARRVSMKIRQTIIVAVLAILAIPILAQVDLPLSPDPTPKSTQTDDARAQKPSPQGAELTGSDLDAWLDGYLPYALSSSDIAGAVVVVVKDGEIVSERGYGYSDVEKLKPVDPERTLFRPGSVSKLVTWTAVMQLVEQGKIDLDADVDQYLDFKISPEKGKPITMRNLMQHTAGFEENAKSVIGRGPNSVPDYVALLKRWTPETIFEPGTTPAYSNYATSLAGYIVQRVSGENFYDYTDRHIFKPLAMNHSSMRQPLPKKLQPDMSKGYARASADARDFEHVGPAPAGSLAASGADMGRFMMAHLNEGELDGQRILAPETARLMHDSPTTFIPGLNRMELGFFETNVNGRQVIAHLGDTSDFHTSLHLFQKENTGFYVSFNSAGKEGAAGTLRIALFHDFADRYFPGPAMPAALDSKTQREHAELMSGSWQSSRRAQSNWLRMLYFTGQTQVGVAEDGSLTVPDLLTPGGAPRKWVEIAPFQWEDPVNHEKLAAKLVDGKPVRWSFDMISPFMVFDRVPWYQDAAWLLPVTMAALAIMFITMLLWPVRALIRRRYDASLALDRTDLRAYRASRIAAAAVVVLILGWIGFISLISVEEANLNGRFDWLLRLLQFFGIFTIIGGLLAAGWNLLRVFRSGRSWQARLWGAVLMSAMIVVTWTALVGGMLSLGMNF